MKSFIKFALCVVISFMLIACDEKDNSGGQAPPANPNKPPDPPKYVDCRSFHDFYVVFLTMKDNSGLLAQTSPTQDRLALASALLVGTLMNSYSVGSKFSNYGKDVKEKYIKYFYSIFQADGLVRSQPLHPLVQTCLERN